MGTTTQRHGTPGGALVIALHGAVANRATWLPLARELPHGVELWCPDLPGHGSRADEPFALESSLELVEALLAMARPRRAVIAGDSLGGYLALLAGARQLRGVAAVVASGCSWSMRGAGGALARASDLPPRLAERLLGTARLERLALALLPRVTDRATAAAIAAGGLRLEARGESLRALAGIDVAKLAGRVRAPLVVVNGVRDWPTRAGEGAMLRANARARRIVIPGTGHGAGFLAPAAFAAAVVSAIAPAELARGASA